MLASLTVRDIVLIERADLQFAAGLNVLTGETGAGKSILLDALGLAAGERAQGRAALRPGAQQASVVAVFELHAGHALRRLLAANGLAAEGEEGDVILRRAVAADGRSRAFLNDQPVGLQLAREIGAGLLEVHGLADDRGLFDAGTHRALLDAFGGHGALAGEVGAHFAALTAAARRCEGLKQARASAAQEIDYLSYAAKELAQLDPETGEEAALAAERALLQQGGKLAEEIAAAADFVSGDGGAEISLSAALRRLSRLSPEGRQAAVAAETALDGALALVQEAGGDLAALLTRLAADPARLERAEERLFALRAAARKYNVASDALAGLRGEFEAKLALLDRDEGSVAAAEKECERLRTVFLKSAAALSAARLAAAKTLELAVAKELAPLKLGQARFRVALAKLPEAEATGGGLERVAFEIATLEGAAFGPLTKIASGGELARFALALKVALSEASPPAVLVFDEVDRGVGGAVADAVGERLQRLAETTQILLVTHSPQVAARAQRHFRITRKGDATQVEELGQDDRVEEIARMLSGAAVTGEARAAAKRLIDEAQAAKPKSRKRVRT